MKRSWAVKAIAVAVLAAGIIPPAVASARPPPGDAPTIVSEECQVVRQPPAMVPRIRCVVTYSDSTTEVYYRDFT